MNWRDMLRSDSLPWLLETDGQNPGVRYFALRDLMALPEDAPEVVEARAIVMTSGPVPRILEAQDPEGYWVKPGSGYGPKYRGTVWQILLLAELGADPADDRVRRGCEYLLSHAVANNGAFSLSDPPVPSSVVPCLNGNLLYALQTLGFREDARVQTALEWQTEAVTGEGNIQYLRSGTSGPCFACSANGRQPCAWGAAKVLRALLSVPADGRTPEAEAAINVAAQFLLSRDPAVADYPYTERVSSTWFKCGFPMSYWSAVLEVASLLVQLDYGADERLQNVLQLILSKQDEQGRWMLENSLNGKTWCDIEEKGQPSKWVTLRALRMLKQLPRQQ